MIVLKSLIKKMFKDAGLEEFSVNKEPVFNYLAITGPCGKPIVNVTDFSVASTLSKTVRELLITDYIRPMLDKHAKAIIDMISYKALRDNEVKEADKSLEIHNVEY